MKKFSFGYCMLLLASAASSRADTIYQIELNTASLIGNVNAPFALDFQLTSGDTSSDVINTATMSQFNFGAGGSVGTGNPFPNSGNASGSLNSSVTLSTSGGTFFSEFSQFFTPGNLLTFQLDLTNVAEPPPTPDEFTFQLIDKTDGEVSTTDPVWVTVTLAQDAPWPDWAHEHSRWPASRCQSCERDDQGRGCDRERSTAGVEESTPRYSFRAAVAFPSVFGFRRG